MERIAEAASAGALNLKKTLSSALVSDEARDKARKNLEEMRRYGFVGTTGAHWR
ncbi:hypothetical protein LZG12_004612 [Salmonella enterica subsp. enterica serovar Thompson]|nr:hypothetical protein [Salmonella enterica subsp. enterica serovar Thompson]